VFLWLSIQLLAEKIIFLTEFQYDAKKIKLGEGKSATKEKAKRKRRMFSKLPAICNSVLQKKQLGTKDKSQNKKNADIKILI